MAMRRCNGTDNHLTRQVPDGKFDPDTMTVAAYWKSTALPGMTVIRCQCGAYFDDTQRATIYPHEFFGQGVLVLPERGHLHMSELLYLFVVGVLMTWGLGIVAGIAWFLVLRPLHWATFTRSSHREPLNSGIAGNPAPDPVEYPPPPSY